MNKAGKKIHKKMLKPAVVFGSEIWAVAEMDMKGQSTWETKIQRDSKRWT